VTSVLSLEQVRAGDTAIAGGKGANLGELAAHGFPVPPGFVVSTQAYREFVESLGLEHEWRGLDGASRDQLARRCPGIQRRIVETEMPQPLAEAILEAHSRLLAGGDGDVSCAVRSSATAEDLAGASFAGQHGTYYYVNAGRLLEVIRRCWASLWSMEAAAYRSTRGIPHASVFMAVVVQEMVRSEVSGVAFTANPVSGARDEILIESSWGMGAAIVDGRVTPDRYILSRNGLQVRERRVAEKRFLVPARVSGARDARLERVSLSMQTRETLREDQVRAVAEWSLKCERHFGAPQDVEWAMTDGRFYLLQSRPITALGRQEIGRGVKGKWVLFKALAENFTDPMTPLMMDLAGNPGPPGLRFFGGRIYMDLDLIRRLVPFEISDDDLASLAYLSGRPSSAPLRWSLRKLPIALLALLATHLAFGVVMARTRGMPNDFMDRFRSLCWRVERDPSMDAVGALRRLFLLPALLDPIGHMPVIVNICSMRFAPWMGALKAMLRRWVPGLRPDAVALLCSGTAGVRSAEMGREIVALARQASRVESVRELLTRHEPEEALQQLRQEPAAREFLTRLDQFLATHGHRAIKEFELRSPRWEEDPAPVLGMVRNHLLVTAGDVDHEAQAVSARAQLEAEIRRRTGGLRWRLIRLAAGRARYYLRLRENSRFYHIMGLGAIRKRILAIEAELLAAGKLKCQDDIFFLTWTEVAALRSGALRWLDVEERVHQRRMEHVRLTKLTPPKTIGVERTERVTGAESDRLEGQGASPGRYQGRARVILDASVDLELHPGEVLVAPYTDPAWTPLFLTAGAAVVEVGSYLSHAGTVAREYGMPCVVDVPDCTRRIQTGTLVEVDGERGTVRILGQRSAA